jgi:hypothetical protein
MFRHVLLDCEATQALREVVSVGAVSLVTHPQKRQAARVMKQKNVQIDRVPLSNRLGEI